MVTTASHRRAALPSGRRDMVVFIQYLRGIAPLLVIWSHLSGYWLYAHHENWRVQDFFYTHIAVPFGLYQNGGQLGVVLFFFVSGYIVTFASRRESVRDFAIKRTFRLAPALWAACLAVLIVRRVAEIAGQSAPTGTGGGSAVAYLRGAFLLDMIGNKTQINGVTWTLVVEVMFYLLTALLIPITRKHPAEATIAMLSIWAAGAFAAHQFHVTAHLDYFTIYVGVLILGRALYLGHCGVVAARVAWGMCLLIAVVSAWTYLECSPVSLLAPGGPAATFAWAFMIFAVLMFANPTRVPRAVRWLSDISYSLYLLHIPIGMLMIDLLLKAGFRFSSAFAFAVVASLLAATVSYRFVERPGQALARRVLEYLRARPPLGSLPPTADAFAS